MVNLHFPQSKKFHLEDKGDYLPDANLDLSKPCKMLFCPFLDVPIIFSRRKPTIIFNSIIKPRKEFFRLICESVVERQTNS